MVRKNALKQALREGKIAKGMLLFVFNPDVVEILGHTGWDFFMLEWEHATYQGIHAAKECFVAADAVGMTPLVKISRNDPIEVTMMLDAGAQGVVIPHVKTAEDAWRAVQACRHQPQGLRSFCHGVRGAGHAFIYNPPNYTQLADEEAMVILLVEEEEGIKNLDAIASVPGVDAIIPGPGDLSASLGVPGQLDHPKVRDAMAKLAEICKQKGVVAGSLPASYESATYLVSKGAQLICYGTDKLFMYHYLRQVRKKLDEAITKAQTAVG